MSTAVPKKMTVLQSTFIGVGSMVGAGIFALLGAAGAVAGSAVWLSFLIAGAIAALQGYSFAKLGATYPFAPPRLSMSLRPPSPCSSYFCWRWVPTFSGSAPEPQRYPSAATESNSPAA